MVKTFDILLDLEKDLYSPSSLLFSVSRNDFNTVQLNFIITQDGTPLDLTNKTVELAVKKPSGLTVYQACEITSGIEGKAKLGLNQQAYIEYGIYMAEVYIRDVNNLAVTSPFWYQSRTPIFNDTTEEAVQSSNDWSALQEALFAYDLRPKITEGFPTITPEYVGQMAYDSLNKITYIASDLTSDSWRTFGAVEGGGGGGSDDTILGDNAPNVTPARIGQMYIDRINKSAYISTGATVEDWEAIDNEQIVKQAVTWLEILDKPTAFTPEIHTHDYVDIQGKPLAFPPEEHGHEILEITGLQDALNLKADDADLLAKADLNHNHEINEIDGLQLALDSKADDADLSLKANSADVYTKLETYNKTEVDNIVTGITEGGGTIVEDNLFSNSSSSALSANQGRILDETKADLNHVHEITEITGLQTSLDSKADDVDLLNKANAIHRHDWAEIDGKPTTFTPEAHNHEINEIDGLQLALDSKADDSDLTTKADVNHVHSYGSLTDIPTTFKPPLASTSTVGGHRVGNGLAMSGEYLLVKSGNGLRTDGATTYQVEIDRNIVDTWYAKKEQLNGLTIWSGTQAEYDAIATKDNSTLYFIKPSELILEVTNLTNAVQLDWEVGTGASWAIYRSEVSGKLGEKLASSLITNTYLDSTASGGKTYYYTLQIEDVSRKTISKQVEATPYSITVYDAKRVEFSGYTGWTVYGDAQATADFGNQFTLQGGTRLKIDTGEKLRFEMPIGQVGSANTGGIIKAKIAGKNEYTIEYGIKFDAPFPWSKGGKVPGFSGGEGYTGGSPAWDGDGFSVRLMWREGGRIIPYVYHYNQPDEFGDTFGETLGYFTDLKEHKITYHAVLNTGANPDGLLQIYLDDVQVFEKTDLIYRTDECKIDTAHIAIFAGGSDASWNMTDAGYIRLNYFDWK